MIARLILAIVVPLFVCIGLSDPAHGLNELTHELINEEAANASTLDERLKKGLGLRSGLREVFQGKRAVQWLREGGKREDDGSFFFGTARYLRHFHDPLRPWDQSGLELFLIGQYESSIRWMQRTNQNAQTRGTGNWSWQDARRFYATALTAANPSERDQAWADTFRALGQAMHLVVDASVPEHARNDPHVLGPLYGNYEYWIEAQHGSSGSGQETTFIQRYLAAPGKPDPAILQQATGDAAAPVPVARLIDTNRYTGTNPNVTRDGPIGIAEFANANFFSENTGHANGDYPFPSVERLIPSQQPAPMTGRTRRYYAKGYGDGLAVDPVLAECALDEAAKIQGMTSGDHKCTDENVWAQVAAATLPRAAGYSAALLDYFFRGRLETHVDGGTLRIRNRTPDETMTGSFELYYDTTDGTRVQLVTWDNLAIPPDAESSPLLIPAPRTDKPPANPNLYLLVFRGQLGLEPDAVAAMRAQRHPVILVFFDHRGLWAGWVSGGQYYAGLWPYLLPEMLYHKSSDPYFGASEQISYWLYSVFVPGDPAASLMQQQVPWELLKHVEVTPAPAIARLNLRFIDNYQQRGQDLIAGVSVLEAETSWRLTIVWADWVGNWSGAEGFLGRNTEGQIDVSPRVVKVCPGHEWAGPFGGTVGPFGPQSLTHPKIYHCPDWWTFGD